MSRISLGGLCGLAFGGLDTVLVIPLYPRNGCVDQCGVQDSPNENRLLRFSRCAEPVRTA